ncbi:MAG: lipopolysaccharide heptosyltransferase II [Deltaproteobacteria bacterium]|nr:lipopolysaccharide heptosyltransferase II [Deltaproteobacteria bacterium]
MIRIRGRRPIDKTKIRRILIRPSNWIGDVVMNIPAIEAIRENFPESSISVAARSWVTPLLENHPAVDHVLPIKKSRNHLSRVFEISRVAREIRGQGFDLAILLQNAFEAAFLTYLAGISLRVGYNTDWRGFLLSHSVIRDDRVLGLHQVEYYLHMLRAMGWDAESRDPRVFVADRDRKAIQSVLAAAGIGPDQALIGLSPGAVFGPAKQWPAERFAAIGDRAAQRWGAKTVVMGSEGDQDTCAEVNRLMKHVPLNLCARTTLGEVMALIERCQYFVTNDSGLMHIGASLHVPMVAVFGSTDPIATGPRSRNARIVRHSVDCSPCLKPECPSDHRCMLSIEPDEVWRELEHLREERSA